jgi:hypothetical protein
MMLGRGKRPSQHFLLTYRTILPPTQSTMFQRVLLLACAAAGTAAQTFYTGKGARHGPAGRSS